MEAHKGVIMYDISLHIDIIRTLINYENILFVIRLPCKYFFLNEIMILNLNIYTQKHQIFSNLKFLSPNKI